MEALAKLGIDGRLLAVQIINFAVLLFLLHRFLYTPLLGMLEKRRALIEKSVEQAKAISEKLATVEAQRKEEFARAQKEAAQIVERATAHAEEKSQALIAKAKHEVEEFLVNARQKMHREKEHMLADAKEELAQIVLNSTRALLNDVSDKDLTDRLTKKAVATLK